MTAKIADFDIARIKRQMHGPTTITTKSVVKQPGSPFYQVQLEVIACHSIKQSENI